MSAGYSGTPLVKKLGIKPGFKIAILNPPAHYRQLIGELPESVTIVDDLNGPLDFIHFFTRQSAELADQFPALKQALASNGMLWISWPKQSAKAATDLTENVVRDIGLKNKLVDVKVAAVDEFWSGLKFVYRIEDRK
jgi:hypothetical protein